MITLLSIQTVTPGREEEYAAIQRRLYELTWSLEPETIRYEHYRSSKPGQFVSLLTFKDLAAFLDHQVAEYHDDVAWEGLFVEHEMQWLDPLQGANTLAPTELPPLPDTLDEKRRFYASLMPASRPAWWDAAKA